MSELFFCVKTFVLTVAIVLVMQIEIGERTIESHAMIWMHTSSMTAPLNSVARGAAKMFDDLKLKIRRETDHYKRKVWN